MVHNSVKKAALLASLSKTTPQHRCPSPFSFPANKLFLKIPSHYESIDKTRPEAIHAMDIDQSVFSIPADVSRSLMMGGCWAVDGCWWCSVGWSIGRKILGKRTAKQPTIMARITIVLPLDNPSVVAMIFRAFTWTSLLIKRIKFHTEKTTAELCT